MAIVVDPIRTISAGKVNLGAFRTYPKGYKPPDDNASEYQTIPLNKIEDFGVHCKQYYSMDVTYFKSALDKSLLDSLWNHYWVRFESLIHKSVFVINAKLKKFVCSLRCFSGEHIVFLVLAHKR